MSSLRFAQELEDRVLEISPGGETRGPRHGSARFALDIDDRVLDISGNPSGCGGETRGSQHGPARFAQELGDLVLEFGLPAKRRRLNGRQGTRTERENARG